MESFIEFVIAAALSLSWSIPVAREDGEELFLSEIEGYGVYIDGVLQPDLIDAAVTSAEFPDIDYACFKMTTFDKASEDSPSQESKFSNEVCKGLESGNDIDPSKWTLHYASSWETDNWLMLPEYAWNRGNPDEHELWHSRYTPDEAKFPHEIQVDMGHIYQVTGFKVKQREGGGNAVPKGYTFSLSNDGSSWHIAASGEFPPGDQLHVVSFPEESARFFYFNFSSNQDGINQQISVDEIYMTGVNRNPNPPIMIE
jgi:hypothetical protein